MRASPARPGGEDGRTPRDHPVSNEFDAIVVGSGPAGATVARELSRQRKRVLILERGGNAPLKEGFGMARILSKVSVSDDLITVRALTTGGTTAIYFAVADDPPLETFHSLGIDLSGPLAEAKAELPLSILPDHLIGAQSLRLRQSAMDLGYAWKRGAMLVDLARCKSSYTYEAKWNARTYVRDAVETGATLVNGARVLKVLTDQQRATGVEYEVRINKKETELRRAYATKIVLSAGGASSPIILRDSGVKNVVSRGFGCNPGFAVFGTIRGMKAGDNFIGNGGTVVEENLEVGDANPARVFYRMMMLGNRQWLRSFFHSRSIGVGVMVKEGLGGELREDGRYYKRLSDDDLGQLRNGEEVARRIIRNAGGTDIVRFPMSAGHIGGSVRIGEHVDHNLETELANLHVCDGSVLPETVKTPTLALICLGKYLANRLSPAL